MMADLFLILTQIVGLPYAGPRPMSLVALVIWGSCPHAEDISEGAADARSAQARGCIIACFS